MIIHFYASPVMNKKYTKSCSLNLIDHGLESTEGSPYSEEPSKLSSASCHLFPSGTCLTRVNMLLEPSTVFKIIILAVSGSSYSIKVSESKPTQRFSYIDDRERTACQYFEDSTNLTLFWKSKNCFVWNYLTSSTKIGGLITN
jgi:hypothetical protein